MEVQATIPLSDACDHKTLAQKTYELVKEWNGTASRVAIVENRSVVRAGPRTFTVEFICDTPFEEADDGFANEDPLHELREAHITLSGYSGTLTRMSDELTSNVTPLLEKFSQGLPIQRQRQAMFSLRANIMKLNPFLVFYLRDVPVRDVASVRLELTGKPHGNLVSARITATSVTVSARTPSALTGTASGYLAAPALSAQHRF